MVWFSGISRLVGQLPGAGRLRAPRYLLPSSVKIWMLAERLLTQVHRRVVDAEADPNVRALERDLIDLTDVEAGHPHLVALAQAGRLRERRGVAAARG